MEVDVAEGVAEVKDGWVAIVGDWNIQHSWSNGIRGEGTLKRVNRDVLHRAVTDLNKRKLELYYMGSLRDRRLLIRPI